MIKAIKDEVNKMNVQVAGNKKDGFAIYSNQQFSEKQMAWLNDNFEFEPSNYGQGSWNFSIDEINKIELAREYFKNEWCFQVHKSIQNLNAYKEMKKMKNKITITKNYMTGREEGTYRNYNFKLNGYGGFSIANENGSNIPSFQPYAGNKLLDCDRLTVRKKLLSKIRYRIDKYFCGVE